VSYPLLGPPALHGSLPRTTRSACCSGPWTLPEELAGAGFTPAFRPQHPSQVELGADPVSVFGIGANMALRRSTFECVGGFDELLGAGAPVFKAAEDTDYALRLLRRGIKVATSGEAPVLHYGARADDDLLALRRNYVLGMAGYLQKHVRLSDRVSREYLRRRVEVLAGENDPRIADSRAAEGRA